MKNTKEDKLLLREARVLSHTIAKFPGDVAPETCVTHTDEILHGVLTLPVHAHALRHPCIVLTFVDI